MSGVKNRALCHFAKRANLGRKIKRSAVKGRRGNKPAVKKQLLVTTTNHDGRTDRLLIDETAITAGTYELHFFTADYFAKQRVKLDELPFLDEIIIRFPLPIERRTIMCHCS